MIEISIIVPIYNSEKYLDKCIQSILSQTVECIELILIDDGSTDHSYKICEKYAKVDYRIKLIKISNSGVSKARNIGIDLATGKYIMFVDSDDYVEKNWCIEHLSEIRKNPYGLIISGYNIINCSRSNKEYIRHIIGDMSHTILQCKDDIFNLYRDNYLNSPWNKIYNRNLIIENKIHFNEDLSLGEDLLFNINYIKCTNGKITFINSPLYNYILRDKVSLDNKYYSDLFDIYVLLFKELQEFFDSFGVDFNRISRQFYNIYLNHLMRVLKNSFYVSSEKNIIEKIKYNSKVMKSAEFTECIEKCNLENYSWFYLKIIQSRRYSLLFIYENFAKIKKLFKLIRKM